MRKAIVVGTMTATIAVVAAWQSTAPQTRKPERIEQFMPFRAAAPPTLEAMWLKADCVAVLRVLKPLPTVEKQPKGTTYSVEVVELKTHPRLPARNGKALVDRNNSEVDMGDYVLKRVEEDFPPFIAGGEYVVFLNWNDYIKAFVIAYGPDASYEIVNGRIQTTGHGAVASNLDGQPADRLLDTLRAMAKQRRRK